MRQAFEEGQLHHLELLLRQGVERRMHVPFPLRGVDAGIAARGRIGDVEQLFGRAALLAAAPSDVDAAIMGDTEYPGRGGRFAGIEQVGLAPDRLHHVLGDVGRGEWSEPQPDHLGVHAGREMIEQGGEGFVVVVRPDRGQQLVELALVGPRRRRLAAQQGVMAVEPGCHAPLPSRRDVALPVAAVAEFMLSAEQDAPLTGSSMQVAGGIWLC